MDFDTLLFLDCKRCAAMPVSGWMCRYGLTQEGAKVLAVKMNEHIEPFGAAAVRQRSEITDELTAASSRMKTKRRHRQTMTTTTTRRNRKVSLVSIDFLIVILFNSDFSTPVFFSLFLCLVSFFSSFFFIFHVVSDDAPTELMTRFGLFIINSSSSVELWAQHTLFFLC